MVPFTYWEVVVESVADAATPSIMALCSYQCQISFVCKAHSCVYFCCLGHALSSFIALNCLPSFLVAYHRLQFKSRPICSCRLLG